MDYWRDYFKSSNGDIFETIEKAIIVAASDFPNEFGIRRDGIAQILFSCKLIKCSGCDRVELGLPANHEHQHDKESNNQISNYNYGVAEALTDEIEEESQIFDEVLRIKEIVDNYQDESESVLYNSLRKLQLMNLSVETLKATEIGKSVNVLRKHVSKDVNNLAKTLIEAWKDMVDEWVIATEKTQAVSEATPESINPSVLDEEEEGLPSPPLDDLAFFYPHTSLELSEFFDGMDEYGDPGNSCRTEKSKQKKPSNVSTMVRKNEPKPVVKREESLAKVKNIVAAIVKPVKPSVPDSARGRPVKPNTERKLQTVPKRPQQSNLRASGEATAQEKFETAKRKLQERYQQAENAKKQRTIQVMELHDLPKPKGGFSVRNQQNVRPGSNHNRHR